jgi:hypothetical protein
VQGLVQGVCARRDERQVHYSLSSLECPLATLASEPRVRTAVRDRDAERVTELDSTIRSFCYGNTAQVRDVKRMVCFPSGASGRLYKGVTGPLEAIEDMEDMRNILS